ncbi:MAG: sugar phosphate isomerase/epimerase family protein [Thermoproteota archaeon]
MKVSIASYSFHGLREAGMIDVFGYLETCKYRYRVDVADLWNGIIGLDDLIFDEEFQRKLVEALREREMTVINYHVDGCHIWEDDPELRERNYHSALKHLKVARIIGAKTVRIDAGGKGHEWTAEQFDLIVKRFKEYAAICADFGCQVGPESHWGPELVPDNMERLAKAVNHPNFGILLHIGHWEGAPEEEGDRRLARYAVHTHIDARVTRIRLEAAIRLLIDAGYEGYWGVEHHSGKNEYAEVEYQLAEVRRALQKIRLEKG